MTFGEMVRKHRKSMGLRQDEFLAKNNITFTRAYFSMIESKGEIPQPLKLFAIIKACNMNVDDTLKQIIEEKCASYREKQLSYYKRAKIVFLERWRE